MVSFPWNTIVPVPGILLMLAGSPVSAEETDSSVNRVPSLAFADLVRMTIASDGVGDFSPRSDPLVKGRESVRAFTAP